MPPGGTSNRPRLKTANGQVHDRCACKASGRARYTRWGRMCPATGTTQC